MLYILLSRAHCLSIGTIFCLLAKMFKKQCVLFEVTLLGTWVLNLVGFIIFRHYMRLRYVNRWSICGFLKIRDYSQWDIERCTCNSESLLNELCIDIVVVQKELSLLEKEVVTRKAFLKFRWWVLLETRTHNWSSVEVVESFFVRTIARIYEWWSRLLLVKVNCALQVHPRCVCLKLQKQVWIAAGHVKRLVWIVHRPKAGRKVSKPWRCLGPSLLVHREVCVISNRRLSFNDWLVVFFFFFGIAPVTEPRVLMKK